MDTAINFSNREIILGTPSETPPVFNLYVAVAKMYIVNKTTNTNIEKSTTNHHTHSPDDIIHPLNIANIRNIDLLPATPFNIF